MKNKIEKEMAIAMNTGVVAVGGESRPVASSGRMERSYRGETLGAVQLILAELDVFAHDPSTPKKTLGPSRLLDALTCTDCNVIDGTTVTSAT